MGGNKKRQRNKKAKGQGDQMVSSSAADASVESPEKQDPVSAPEEVTQDNTTQIISQKSAEPSVESPDQQAPVTAQEVVTEDNTTQEIKVEDKHQEENVTITKEITDDSNKNLSDKVVEQNQTDQIEDGQKMTEPSKSDEALLKVNVTENEKLKKEDDVQVTSKISPSQNLAENVTQKIKAESPKKIEEVPEQKIADPIKDVTPSQTISNKIEVVPEVKVQTKVEPVPIVQDNKESSKQNQRKSKKQNNYFATEEDKQNSPVKVMKADLKSPFNTKINQQGQGDSVEASQDDLTSGKKLVQANSLSMTQSVKVIPKYLEPQNIDIQKLILRVKYETKFGQDLWLLGSPDYLSKWNPNENGGRGGMQMKWTDGHLWVAEIPYELVNADPSKRFEFKFMVKFNDTNKKTYDVIRWEGGHINHNFDGLHIQKFLTEDYTKNFIMNKMKDSQTQSVVNIGTFQSYGKLHFEGSKDIKQMPDNVDKCTIAYDKTQKALIFHQYFQA